MDNHTGNEKQSRENYRKKGEPINFSLLKEIARKIIEEEKNNQTKEWSSRPDYNTSLPCLNVTPTI